MVSNGVLQVQPRLEGRSMKKFAVTAAALFAVAGLAACQSPTEKAADSQADAAADQVKAEADRQAAALKAEADAAKKVAGEHAEAVKDAAKPN
jgi:hypothetical protein